MQKAEALRLSEERLFEQKRARALRYRWYIVAVLAAQYLFVFFHRVSPAIVAEELMESFGVSATALGVLASAYFYPYAFMQIPIGILSDSWGARKTVSIFGLLAGLGAVFFALSPSFGVAVFSRVLVGLGLSAIFVPSMRLLCYWFREGEYAIVSGIFLAVGGFGWLSAATPLALLVQGLGWVITFILMGSITLALAGVNWFVVSDRPEDRGFPGMVSRTEQAGAARNVKADILRVLTERKFWPFALWNFLMGAALFGFCGLWAGPYLTGIYHLSKPGAANILVMIALALIVGGPLLGYLSEKVIKSRKNVLLACSFVHTLCWLAMLVAPRILPVPALYAIFFLLGMTAGASTGVVITAVKEHFPLEMAGISVGMVNMFPFFGGIFFQPLVGLVLDTGGAVNGAYQPHAFQAVFLVFFSMGLVGLWLMWWAQDRATLRAVRK